MEFCPCCGREGYREMGVGDYFCSNPDCPCYWNVDNDGKTHIKK